MTAHHHRRLLPIVSIILFFLLGSLYWIRHVRCTAFSCINFSQKNDWNIKEVYESTGKSWRGMLVNRDRFIRLEVVQNTGKAEADEFTKIRLMTISGLYDTARSPYPGAISGTIRCDDVYKPHPETLMTQDGVSVTYFSGGLNSRMQYGTCVDTQISYRTYSGFFYCGRNRVWAQLELIVKNSDGDHGNVGPQFFRTIRCQ